MAQKITKQKPIKTVSQPTFQRRRLVFGIAIIIVTVALATLTYFAKQDPYFPIDLTITRDVQEVNSPVFDAIMKFITFIGEAIPGTAILFVCALIIFIKKERYNALQLIFSTLGIEAIGLGLKIFVGRVRPDPKLIHQAGHFIRNDSFPSGHVLYYIGFYGFLLFLVFTLPPKTHFRKLLIAVLAILILLVGPSRIYLGAHWFSDVLGAYLIGFLWLSSMVYLHKKFHPQVKTEV